MTRFRTLAFGQLRITDGVAPALVHQSKSIRATLAVGTERVYDVVQVLSVFDSRYLRLAVFRGKTTEGHTLYALAEVGQVTGTVVVCAAVELLDEDDPSPLTIFSHLLAAHREAATTSQV